MKRSQIRNLIVLAAISALVLGVAGGWFGATLLNTAGNPARSFGGGGHAASCLLVAGAAGCHPPFHARLSAPGAGIGGCRGARCWPPTPTQARRFVPQGHPDIAGPGNGVQRLADRYVQLQGERASAIRQARADLEEERNLLAALMSELTEGVLVCNLDGQILLYNRNARTLLARWAASGPPLSGWAARFSACSTAATIAHALEQVQDRHQRRDEARDERPC